MTGKDAAPYWLLLFVAIFSLAIKLNVLSVGAPYVTIDDQTMYEGGFMVWYGQAPPQRMYLESWVSGITSIATYVALNAGEGALGGINLIASAYQDFTQNPDPYVISYRLLMLGVDLATALFVFLLGRRVLQQSDYRDWASALAAAFYLLSFNTLWSYLVARPDTLTAFFAVFGMYLYYRSDFGRQKGVMLGSGLILGLAAGMKLHGAFFVIFICLDMWRVWGFGEAFRRVFLFVCISLLAFAIAAGSLLFDPTLYVKLRLLNARDDASPWLEWGDQFVTMFRGTGWLLIPAFLGTIWFVRKKNIGHSNPQVASLIFIAICWLVLFSLLRVLRAYWMLPALPLIYLVAAFGVMHLRPIAARAVTASALIAVLGSQLAMEMSSFRSVPFEQLRTWIENNVEPDDPMYVLGFNAVNLPLNARAIENLRQVNQGKIQSAVQAGESFTQRHIRLWEERARLLRLDMLESKSFGGFNYYGWNEVPLEIFESLYSMQTVRFILKQENVDLSEVPQLRQSLASDFRPEATLIGPGGGGRGVSYTVFRRK